MPTRVIVYDDRIRAAFLPGGSIAQNVTRIGRTNKDAAHHFVPVRTGALKASLYFAVYPSGPNHFSYVVGTKNPTAIYTLAGTHGPIYANTGLLWIRPMPYSKFPFRPGKGLGGRTPMFWVHGQKQNDWLGRSLFVTMKQYGL
jgi:hypothetical protein